MAAGILECTRTEAIHCQSDVSPCSDPYSPILIERLGEAAASMQQHYGRRRTRTIWTSKITPQGEPPGCEGGQAIKLHHFCRREGALIIGAQQRTAHAETPIKCVIDGFLGFDIRDALCIVTRGQLQNRGLAVGDYTHPRVMI